MEKKNIIDLRNITVRFDGDTVLDDISLSIGDGEFVTLLGSSGCGKTTTLRIIAGFLEPHEGEVFFDSKNMNGVPAHKREVNTIFQRYALFPHLNVFENIAFGLRVKKLKEKEIVERVQEMLELVNLKGFEKRSITTLSGGQQQRVAIARALAMKPAILCFDEPTSALDPELTGEVLSVIRSLAAQDTTMIIVTHEMSFARDVSDTVLFMEEGVVAVKGTPDYVFGEGATPRMKAFIGAVSNHG